MKKHVFLLGFLALFFLAVPAWAQTDRASITGTVTDSTGAVIPGVSVTAINVDTRVQTPTTTNPTGIYRILNLPIGRYSLLIKKEGFQNVERTEITLTISQVAEINVTMNVGKVAQAIEVKAQAPILESQTADLGSTMSLEAYRALPLSINGGRDIMAFAFASTPSVEGNSWTSYISGTQAFSNEVLIDGTLAQESETGQQLESEPPMEAVEEFRVDTGGMGGSAGMYTAGGTFMFTLKSGTNQFHGSAVLFMQNEAFNANSWMNDFSAAANPSEAWEFKKPRNRQSDYAFSGGGPVIKNRTFVFGAWEQNRMSNYTMGGDTLTVPTAQFLQGNFSALLNTGKNLGTDPGGNTIYQGAIFDRTTGLVFPNNTIPTTRFSTVAQKIIPVFQQYYKPLAPGLTNNDGITVNNNPWFHQSQLSVKVDHNFSATNRLASSFIWTQRPRILDDQGGVWDPSDPAGTGGPLSHARNQKVSDRKFRLSESHNFSSNVLNVVSYTYERFRNPSIATSASGNWPSQLGLGSNYAGNFPSISFGSAVNGYSETSIGNSDLGWIVDNNNIGDDTLTWIKGRHTVTFGGEMRAFEIANHGANGTLGFNFSNNQTGAPTAAYNTQVGFGFASFLLGGVASASEGTPSDLYGRRKSLSIFANDSFKASTRLTLNYGLNWNQTYPFHEKYGHWANYSNTAINPTYGIPGEVVYLNNGGQTFEGSARWSDFAPHLGFAYKISNRVVARAAYSLFDIPMGTDYWNGVPYGFAPGYYPSNQVPATSNFAPAFDWDNGYPGKNVSGTLDPNFLQWTMVTVSPQTLETGITNQWNAGTEIQLTNNTRLSLNYLGTRGTHLHDGSLQQNEGPPSAYTSFLQANYGANEWAWIWDNPSAAAAGVKLPYPGYSGYAFAALSPFPVIANNWDYIYYVASPLGRSEYDAIQAEVTRRTSSGLTMDMSYTLARQRATYIPNGSETGSNFEETWAGSSSLQNLYDLSYAANDINPYDQSIVKGYILYVLPFGKGRSFLSNGNRWVNGAVSGWTLGTLLYYSTGTPLSLYTTNYYPGLSSAIYPIVGQGADMKRYFVGKKFNPNNLADSGNQYFTPSGFSAPSFGNFGNSGPYVAGLNGFGSANESLSAYKDFKIKEGMKLQFRAEFYNLFNRHYFNNPNTTIGGAYFGNVTSVGGSPRNGQLGARFEW